MPYSLRGVLAHSMSLSRNHAPAHRAMRFVYIYGPRRYNDEQGMRVMTLRLAALAAFVLAGCQYDATAPGDMPATETGTAVNRQERVQTIKHTPPDQATMRLKSVLQAQPEGVKARYRYRNPEQTLTFFGVAPGQTVVEALPGGGWYSKILIDYLGPDGHLVGADYPQSMWPLFGFFSDEFIAGKTTWTEDWPAEARTWASGDGAKVSAFKFGSMPRSLRGQADVVLMIRSLHNLARFEGQGGYLTMALRDAYDALKPGGTLGIVQHWGPDELPDSWADGSKGYLKRDFVIEAVSNAGFEYVDSSGINHNHRDKPTEADLVWRLPPTLITSRDDPELRARMQEIGESNRMTLKFRKPR